MLEGSARREDTISQKGGYYQQYPPFWHLVSSLLAFSILPSGIQYPPFWHLVSLCTHLNNTMLGRMPTSQYKKGVSYVLIISSDLGVSLTTWRSSQLYMEHDNQALNFINLTLIVCGKIVLFLRLRKTTINHS